MEGVSKGNAEGLYNDDNNGWFIGFFVSDDPYRQSNDIEVKWKQHQPSSEKKKFVSNHSAKSMCILIKGSFRLDFKRDGLIEEVTLTEPGDYVIWLPNVEHCGYAQQEDTVVLTLRWPSLYGDRDKRKKDIQ